VGAIVGRRAVGLRARGEMDPTEAVVQLEIGVLVEGIQVGADGAGEENGILWLVLVSDDRV